MRALKYSGLVWVLAALLLSGCATRQSLYKPAPKPTTVAGIRRADIAELRGYGVQVIQLGETFRFVLMSDAVFNPDSANIRPEYRFILNTLAELINTYDKDDVQVAGYTDDQGNVPRQQALTTRQAQVIANFLWDKGIDSQLTYAVGFNRENAVDWNSTAHGRHNNRRVEISFRFYPEKIPYA